MASFNRVRMAILYCLLKELEDPSHRPKHKLIESAKQRFPAQLVVQSDKGLERARPVYKDFLEIYEGLAYLLEIK